MENISIGDNLKRLLGVPVTQQSRALQQAAAPTQKVEHNRRSTDKKDKKDKK